MASVIDILLKAKDKASKEIDKVTDSLEEMGEATTSGAENTEAFNMGIGDLAKKAATVAGVVAGVGAVIKQGFEFAKEGAELDAARDKFDRLAASIGTTGDALLGDLKDATRGMFSDAQLVAQATDMMSLGLAKTEEQAIRLASSSAALNMNMNALTLTLTN
ncbi:MAG: hypothetical protein GY776_14545 [Alteromonas sp.]|nr:hypothetical protein [Alteromonas sp.]